MWILKGDTSKNIYQSEIDAVAELCDFLRYNVDYMTQLYKEQPGSAPGIWNRMEHRPLEGFVFAITPFNFTSIAANLCVAPAMLGNVVVWKPADSQIYSAEVIMEVLEAAGQGTFWRWLNICSKPNLYAKEYLSSASTTWCMFAV